ncbi:hypothetical protein YPPY14_0548, partial [Yersinia pestis PY-14]
MSKAINAYYLLIFKLIDTYVE